MPARASEQAASRRRQFTLNRVLEAPRAMVFRAFVDPERMKLWWAPRGFSLLSCALDLREGGAWRMRIRSDETGAIQTEAGIYREIRAPERLVFTPSWIRSNRTLTPTTVVTVAFAEQDGRTKVSFTQADFHSDEYCRSHEAGWPSSFSHLSEKVIGGNT